MIAFLCILTATKLIHSLDQRVCLGPHREPWRRCQGLERGHLQLLDPYLDVGQVNERALCHRNRNRTS